jgi:hypothetical protein
LFATQYRDEIGINQSFLKFFPVVGHGQLALTGPTQWRVFGQYFDLLTIEFYQVRTTRTSLDIGKNYQWTVKITSNRRAPLLLNGIPLACREPRLDNPRRRTTAHAGYRRRHAVLYRGRRRRRLAPLSPSRKAGRPWYRSVPIILLQVFLLRLRRSMDRPRLR